MGVRLFELVVRLFELVVKKVRAAARILRMVPVAVEFHRYHLIHLADPLLTQRLHKLFAAKLQRQILRARDPSFSEALLGIFVLAFGRGGRIYNGQ